MFVYLYSDNFSLCFEHCEIVYPISCTILKLQLNYKHNVKEFVIKQRHL
jgi:hypothetical protein